MDIFIIVCGGVILAIPAALVAIFRKKGIWKILVYALSGFVIGLPIGYILAPFILIFQIILIVIRTQGANDNDPEGIITSG